MSRGAAAGRPPRPRCRGRATVLTVGLAAAFVCPGASRAQQPDTLVRSPVAETSAALPPPALRPLSASRLAPTPEASPLVPPAHWAWRAARRLHALGLAPTGFDRGRSLRTRRELAWVFERAAERAERDRPELAPLARGYAARFGEEFGNVLGGAALPARAAAQPVSDASAGMVEEGTAREPAALALAVGYERLIGRVGGGIGYFSNDWTGALPVPDTVGAFLDAEGSVVLGRHLSLHAEPLLRRGGAALRQAEAVLVLGPIGAWAGRRSFSFGSGEDGGIVMSPHVAMDGFGAFLAQPIHFPWLLRAMGPIQIESFLAKAYGGDRIRDPYFIGFHGTFSPHPRLTVDVNRGALFAGRGNAPITLRNMLFLVRGGVGSTRRGDTGAFANDMLSVGLTYRPPTDPGLPLVTWLEWGMDDAAGMWHRFPGVIAGARAGMLPGLPWFSLGLQWLSLPNVGSTNSIWYRNFALRQGWTDYGVPIGQELGGEGRELRLTAEADAFAARLRLMATGYGRLRGEQNLLAPERAGRSAGGGLQLAARLAPAFDLRFEGAAERGDGWSSAGLSTSLRWMW